MVNGVLGVEIYQLDAAILVTGVDGSISGVESQT